MINMHHTNMSLGLYGLIVALLMNSRGSDSKC